MCTCIQVYSTFFTRFKTYRFIPGTSASDVHYQAYLIDGITRWNRDRAAAFLGGNSQCPRTFDVALQQKVLTDNNIIIRIVNYFTMLQIDSLSEKVLGRPVLRTHNTPNKYSGELFGVQYLYAQSGEELPEMIEEEVDEGFEDNNQQEYPENIDATLSSDDDSEVQHVHIQVLVFFEDINSCVPVLNVYPA